MHVVVDLDQTLVDTRNASPYRRTKEGRRYIEDHIDEVRTESCDMFVDVMKRLHRRNGVTVVTNSTEAYGRAVLEKHGFPIVPIIGNASKPFGDSLEKVMGEHGIGPEEVLLIGDRPTDILEGHRFEVASVGALWVSEYTEAKLKKAEPVKIISELAELEETIIEFENGQIEYAPRTLPERYWFLDDDYEAPPRVEFFEVEDYIVGEKNGFNKFIWAYKNLKRALFENIKKGVREPFFYNGKVCQGANYWHTYKLAKEHLEALLDELELEGTTLLVPAPNSLPEYCYKTDVNGTIAFNFRRNDDRFVQHNGRTVYRVYPKEAAHCGGDRSETAHYDTIGIPKNLEIDMPDNIVIFDDIRTSGNQIRAIAKILVEAFGYEGNIYGVTFGATKSA